MKLQPDKTYILDGAMGTELQRRGVKTKLPLWSAKALFDCPDLVKDVHKAYIKAGSDIIVTNTFRTQRRTLNKAGLGEKTEAINKLAVQLAVEARTEVATKPVLIAASVTTLEDCYQPDLVPDNKTLQKEHQEQVEILAALPIDLFLLETFGVVRDIVSAAQAVSQTNKPLIASFVLKEDGNLLSGETLKQVVTVLDKFNPLAYMINCVPLDVATRGLKILKSVTDKPVGAAANGDGEASDDLGWQFKGQDLIQKYTDHCRQWKRLGAQIIGGCCGTNPEYTRAYSKIK